MSDRAGISLTIKYPEAAKFAGAPWAVFHGTVQEVRDQVTDYFALDTEATKDLSVHELAIIADKTVRGSAAVASVLGGTPVADKPATTDNPWAQFDSKDGDQPAKPIENPHAGLIDKLTHAATVDELKTLWAKNKDAFSDEAVKAAYGERGKALTS